MNGGVSCLVSRILKSMMHHMYASQFVFYLFNLGFCESYLGPDENRVEMEKQYMHLILFHADMST